MLRRHQGDVYLGVKNPKLSYVSNRPRKQDLVTTTKPAEVLLKSGSHGSYGNGFVQSHVKMKRPSTSNIVYVITGNWSSMIIRRDRRVRHCFRAASPKTLTTVSLVKSITQCSNSPVVASNSANACSSSPRENNVITFNIRRTMSSPSFSRSCAFINIELQ